MMREALLGLLGVQLARAPRPAPLHDIPGEHGAFLAEENAVREFGRQIRKAELVRGRFSRALAECAERTDHALGEVLDIQRGDGDA